MLIVTHLLNPVATPGHIKKPAHCTVKITHRPIKVKPAHSHTAPTPDYTAKKGLPTPQATSQNASFNLTVKLTLELIDKLT